MKRKQYIHEYSELNSVKLNENHLNDSIKSQKLQSQYSIKLTLFEWDQGTWQELCSRAESDHLDPESLDIIQRDGYDYLDSQIKVVIQNRSKCVTVPSQCKIKDDEVIFERKCVNEECQTKWLVKLDVNNHKLDFFCNQKCEHASSSLVKSANNETQFSDQYESMNSPSKNDVTAEDYNRSKQFDKSCDKKSKSTQHQDASLFPGKC